MGEHEPLRRCDLDSGWEAFATSGPSAIGDRRFAAVVPGVVHTDLLAAGLVPDPFVDDNESVLSWIGLVDWTYEGSFSMTAGELSGSARHDMVFEGLDTVSEVFLNDVPLGATANQHRTYRFDVTSALTAGENRVQVAFRSPVRHADEEAARLGWRPRTYPHPFNAMRKSAASFGWDWGPATCTSGIWRPVRLESWSGARLATVLVRAEPDGDSGGCIRVTAKLDVDVDAPRVVAVRVAGVERRVTIAADQSDAEVTVVLDGIERWWPAGYGDQPLYEVEIVLEQDGAILDTATRRVGFRSIEWDHSPDAEGAGFQLIVNDRPVFVKGWNWIPDDAFPSRVDRARYRRRLGQAKAANANLIRVWGGGIYEADEFYEACDELGLLTWQDFLFACAAYAEEEPLRSEVEAEARDNVARIAHHASLVLFAGNNENLWGYEDWGWKERLDGKTWGAHYYFDLLPRVVDTLAPATPYIPGSPFSPGAQHPNDESHGSTHLWDQWNRLDWRTYRDHRPRFVAEFGWQGPAAWTTLIRAISDEPLTPDSPGMIAHQKAASGYLKLLDGLIPHYRVPDDMESWHWAMQLNQADAVRFALEWFRAQAPRLSGAIVWQLNDCWPAISWAAIDAGEREKPLYHAIAKAFAPRAISVQRADGGFWVTLSNDVDLPWEGQLVVTRIGFDGVERVSETVSVAIDARTTGVVAVTPEVWRTDDTGGELLVATALGIRAIGYFAEPRDCHLPHPRFTSSIRAAGESQFELTITAATFLRDLTILVDRISPAATVNAGLVTLLPGESFTFVIANIDRLDEEALARPGVVRTANELVVI